jgi:hypothetical protein
MTDGDTFLSIAKQLTFQTRNVNTATLSENLRDGWKLKSEVYNINTGQKYNFHQPSSDLSLYQKEACIRQQV